MSSSPSTRRIGKWCAVGLLLAVIGLGVWMVVRFLLGGHYVRQAEEAMQKHHYAQALTAYEKALEYRSDSSDLHLATARSARLSGNYIKAQHHLTRCRELQNGVSEEQQFESYLLRAQAGEVEQVEKMLRPYLANEGPRTPLVLEALSRGYIAMYRPLWAWRCLSRWLELEPNNPEALFRRGIWFSFQSDTKRAKADYQRVLEIDPTRIDARLSLADILQSDNKIDEVVQQYEAVLKQDPSNARALKGLAQNYAEMRRLEEAHALLDRLPQEEQETADVYSIRGIIERRAQRFEKAEEYLRKALELEPHHRDACYNLMLCLQGEEEALELRERLEQIEKDEKRLIEITTQELSKSPNNADLLFELGQLYLRFRMNRRAEKWLHRALKIDPDHRKAHEALLKYYEKQPNAGEKAEIHRRALKRLSGKSE